MSVPLHRIKTQMTPPFSSLPCRLPVRGGCYILFSPDTCSSQSDSEHTQYSLVYFFKIERSAASLVGVTKKSVSWQEIRQSYDFYFIMFLPLITVIALFTFVF